MRTIHIGTYGKGSRGDLAISFENISSEITSPSENPGLVELARPQYLIHLFGPTHSVKIYAGSQGDLEKLENVLASEDNRRISPGHSVLAIHIHKNPEGWPYETIGSFRVRKAPGFILAQARASFPDNAQLLYPFQHERGIEVIQAGHDRLVVFMPYSRMKRITVEGNALLVSFVCKKVNSAICSLAVVNANKALTSDLARSLLNESPRRLVINHQITGISLTRMDGKSIVLGKPAIRGQEASLK